MKIRLIMLIFLLIVNVYIVFIVLYIEREREKLAMKARKTRFDSRMNLFLRSKGNIKELEEKKKNKQ
jgi:uncharacterized membrane protein